MCSFETFLDLYCPIANGPLAVSIVWGAVAIVLARMVLRAVDRKGGGK